MLAIRTTDDRDRPIRVPLGRVRWVVRGWARGLDLSRRGVVRGIWRGLRRPPLWLGLSGIGLLFTLVLLALHDPAMGLGLFIITPVAAPLLMLVLITGRGLIGLGGELPRRVRLALLSAARCPRCEYDIFTLEAEVDTCITCPECGAAWNWDAIGDRGGREPVVVVLNDGGVKG